VRLSFYLKVTAMDEHFAELLREDTRMCIGLVVVFATMPSLLLVFSCAMGWV
jgi:hypothetical protein